MHETEALLTVEPDRIGHGTFLIPELAGGSDLADIILAAKIPIGKCCSLSDDMLCVDSVFMFISVLLFVKPLCHIVKVAICCDVYFTCLLS